MRTYPAVELPSKVAVVAQHSKSLWVILGFEPTIHLISRRAQIVFAALLATVTVNMVNAQKWFVGQSTALAFPAVCLKCFMSNFLAMTLVNRSALFSVLFVPSRRILFGVFNQAFTVRCVISAVIYPLAFPFRFGCLSLSHLSAFRGAVMVGTLLELIREFLDRLAALFAFNCNHTLYIPQWLY